MYKYLIIIFSLTIIIAACQNKQKSIHNSIIQGNSDTYKPGFGELMGNIQIHHAKLWFAGNNDNWRLAQFEMHELNELIEDLEKYQNQREETKLLSMLNPAFKKINTSISLKNKSEFIQNYKYLTQLCNDCHKDTKYEFIKIIIPKNTPVGNQEY